MLRFRRPLATGRAGAWSLGQQRRWSADLDSVAQKVEYVGLFQRVVTFPKRRPFLFQFFFNVAVNGGADLHTQIAIDGCQPWSAEPERQLDLRRLAVFTLFGAVQACTAWYVYVRLFGAMFPGAIRFANKPWREKLGDRQGQIAVLKQTAADNLCYTPLIFFPNFYLFKAMIQGEGWEDLPGLLWVTLQRYKQTFVIDNTVNAAAYVPLDIFIFAVPAWLRMPTTISLTYIYILFLSFFRGAERPHVEAEVTGQAEIEPESRGPAQEMRASLTSTC